MSLLFDSVPSTTTARDSASAGRAKSQLTWQLVFDGVWLARRDGRFAGMVQGGMVQGVPGQSVKLTDACGNICGLYKTLDDAKAALAARSM